MRRLWCILLLGLLILPQLQGKTRKKIRRPAGIANAASEKSPDAVNPAEADQWFARLKNPEALLTVRDRNHPTRVGTAFLLRQFGKVFIATNAHVYLAMEDPEIRSLNGVRFSVRRIFGVQDRDLLFLEPRMPDGMEPVPFEPPEQMHDLASGIPVAIFGNRPNSNVIACYPGRISAPGPDRFEIDADFPEGSSGGPLLDVNGKVLGVAESEVRLLPVLTPHQGQYRLRYQKPEIFCHALRLDQLKLSDLRELDEHSLQNDRVFLERCMDMMSGIPEFPIAGENKSAGPNEEAGQADAFTQKLRIFCHAYSDILGIADERDWESRWLEQRFRYRRKDFQRAMKSAGLDENFEMLVAAGSLLRRLPELPSHKLQAPRVPCFGCDGGGKFSSKRRNPRYNRPRDLVLKYIIDHKNCPVCEGTGRLPLWEDRTVYDIDSHLNNQLAARIKPLHSPFAGLTLGVTEEDFFRSNPFYQGKLRRLFHYRNALGMTYEFQGGHLSPLAISTKLVFLCGKLVSVSIILPRFSDEEKLRYLPGRRGIPLYLLTIRTIVRPGKFKMNQRGDLLYSPAAPEVKGANRPSRDFNFRKDATFLSDDEDVESSGPGVRDFTGWRCVEVRADHPAMLLYDVL